MPCPIRISATSDARNPLFLHHYANYAWQGGRKPSSAAAPLAGSEEAGRKQGLLYIFILQQIKLQKNREHTKRTGKWPLFAEFSFFIKSSLRKTVFTVLKSGHLAFHEVYTSVQNLVPEG